MTKSLLVLSALFIAATSWSQDRVNEIAARVNDAVITSNDVSNLMIGTEKSIRASFHGAEADQKVIEMRRVGLDDLIDRQLILQEFEAKGFKISDKTIDDRVDGIVTSEFAGDRTALIRTLEKQGYTIDQFRKIEWEKIAVAAMRKSAMEGAEIPSEKQKRFEEWIASLRKKAFIKIF